MEKKGCMFCGAVLEVKSHFVVGDVSKQIRVITDYCCPKCDFKPVGNHIVGNLDELNSLLGE